MPIAGIKEFTEEKKKNKNKIRNKNVIRGNKKQAICLKGSRKIWVYLPVSTFCILYRNAKICINQKPRQPSVMSETFKAGGKYPHSVYSWLFKRWVRKRKYLAPWEFQLQGRWVRGKMIHGGVAFLRLEFLQPI